MKRSSIIAFVRCLIGLHCMPWGVSPEMSIWWHCERCGARVEGRATGERKRR